MKKIEIKDKEILSYEPKGIYEMIMEGIRHAQKENIKANSIIINKDFVKTPRLFLGYGKNIGEMPPMICGLECYFIEDELPDNYSFAILEANKTQLDRIKEQAQIDAIKDFLFNVESYYAYEDKDESKTLFEFLNDLKQIAKENGVEL